MKYILNVFSPETWETFQANEASVTGFKGYLKEQAEKNVAKGDIFLCYMTEESVWCGALAIESTAYHDKNPLFYNTDPYVIRFRVKPIFCFSQIDALPMGDQGIRERLTFTKGRRGWGAYFRRPLRVIPPEDGTFLFNTMAEKDRALRCKR